MKRLHRIWNDLAQDDSGQDLIEYALICGVIGAAAVASLASIAGKVAAVLARIDGSFPT